MIVYKVTNKINGKIYIGITTYTLAKRINKHHTASKKFDYKFYRAIRKYGWDSFTWEIIDTANTLEKLKEKEVSWISYYNSYSNGYNSTLGGDGTLGRKVSTETKEKLRIANTGKVISEDTRRKIAATLKGNKNSVKQKGLSSKGVLSKKTKNRMSESHKGKHTGENNISAKLIEKDIVSIRELSSTGFSNTKIAKIYNVSRSAISNIVNKKSWSHIL